MIDIDAGGRPRHVAVRKDAGGWEVVLDGVEQRADVVQVAGRWSLLLGTRSYDISIESSGQGTRVVHVNGQAVPVSIGDPRAVFTRRRHLSGAGASTGPRPIVAPMPGRIVKLLVKRGDVVVARQGLVVIEAMKMENELRAPGAGVVIDVRVSEGASVEAQAVLLVLE